MYTAVQFEPYEISTESRTNSNLAESRVHQFFNSSAPRLADRNVHNINLRKKKKGEMFSLKRQELISQYTDLFSQRSDDEERKSFDVKESITDLENEINNLGDVKLYDIDITIIQKIKGAQYTLEDVEHAKKLLESKLEGLQYLAVICIKKVTSRFEDFHIDALHEFNIFKKLEKIIKHSQSEETCVEIIEIFINFDVIITRIKGLFITKNTVSAVISRIKDFKESYLDVSLYFIAILLNPRDSSIEDDSPVEDYSAHWIYKGLFAIWWDEFENYLNQIDSPQKLQIMFWLIHSMLFEANIIESKERIRCGSILWKNLSIQAETKTLKEISPYLYSISILSEHPNEIIDSIWTEKIVKLLVEGISNPECEEWVPWYKIMSNITLSTEHREKVMSFFSDLISLVDIVFNSILLMPDEKIYKAINLIDCFTYEASQEFIDRLVNEKYFQRLVEQYESYTDEWFDYPKMRALGKVIWNVVNFWSNECLSIIYHKNLLKIIIAQMNLQNWPMVILRALFAIEKIFELKHQNTSEWMNEFEELNGCDWLEKIQMSSNFQVGEKAKSMIEKFYEWEVFDVIQQWDL